jgi:prepilin-type N-terminal cleavage/methylation domain-containing protein
MRSRRGLSLVEVLVAVAVMGIASTGLAAATFWMGRRAVESAGASARTAIVIERSDRLAQLSYDSLPLNVGCRQSAAPPFPYDECVVVTDLPGGTRRVTLVVTPRNRLVRPDTVTFERAAGAPYNPL